MRLSLTEPNVTGNGHLSPVMFAWIPVSESQHNKRRVLALSNLLPYIMSCWANRHVRMAPQYSLDDYIKGNPFKTEAPLNE